MNFEHVSNEALLESLKTFNGVERQAVARMLAYLAEVEERRLHLALAYKSMFDFCQRRLGLSENEAYRRIVAARLVRELPALLEPLRLGTVTLTNVVLLRDIFTPENVDGLILEIAGKTKREVEALVARIHPKPDVPDSIRVVAAQSELGTFGLGAANGARNDIVRALAQPSMKVLSEDRHCITFTGSTALREKLEKARGLMRHRQSTGNDLAATVETAVDLLIEKLEKEKLGKTTRPRRGRASTDPTYISAATRREVTTRDDMQCTFIGPDGERCPAREWLEMTVGEPPLLREPRARSGRPARGLTGWDLRKNEQF